MKPTATTGPIPALIRRPMVRLLLGLLAVVLPVLAVQLAATALVSDRLTRNLFLAVLTPAAAIWAYSTYVRVGEQRQLVELEPSVALRELGVGSLMGMLILLIVVAILASVRAFDIVGTGTFDAVLVPLFMAFAAAPFEELLFRGVLFRIVEQGLGSWLALAISAAIFGGLHLLNENASLFGAIAVALQAGIMLGATFMATRRLWLPIGVHFSWNFMQSGIFGIAVSGSKAHGGLFTSRLTGPDWLTGGNFGLEGSILTVALGLALSVYFLWIARKRDNVMPPPWRRAAALQG